jgi:hypothetical protein
MLNTKIGYSYNDLTIIPAEISHISSRSECNPFIKDNVLPIFTAPMASVVDTNNSEVFLNNGIIPIMPRNIDIETRIKLMNDQRWVALSLKEFENLFIDNYFDRINDDKINYYICVDIANGHMISLYEKCIKAKKLAIDNNYKLTIMTGNIANPDTYEWIIKFNNENNIKIIDYIRVGIGGGSGCITTSNVSAHYPQASLIDECYKIKKYWKNYTSKEIVPYIIADGGIRNYDHVIKALALGADYVMIGSLFAQCIESAGIKINKNANQKALIKFPIEHYENFRIDSKGNVHGYYKESYLLHLLEPWTKELNTAELTYGSTSKEFIEALKKHTERKNSLNEEKCIGPIDVKFFGMASADGQKSIDGEKKKTAEGITKYLLVKYTLAGWVENMISYLRSAMSYTDCKTLEEFIGKPDLIINSISEIQAVNK